MGQKVFSRLQIFWASNKYVSHTPLSTHGGRGSLASRAWGQLPRQPAGQGTVAHAPALASLLPSEALGPHGGQYHLPIPMPRLGAGAAVPRMVHSATHSGTPEGFGLLVYLGIPAILVMAYNGPTIRLDTPTHPRRIMTMPGGHFLLSPTLIHHLLDQPLNNFKPCGTPTHDNLQQSIYLIIAQLGHHSNCASI